MTPEEAGWAVLLPDDPPLEGVTLSMDTDPEDPEEPAEVTSPSVHDTPPPQLQTDEEYPGDVPFLAEADPQPPQLGTPFHRGRARACTAIFAEAEALEERVRQARETFRTEF